MGRDKAKELFSGYYEGSLESGLSQMLKQRLERDPVLAGEYKDFEDAMKQLATLSETSVAIPFDLNERIFARIDDAQANLAAERRRLPNWWRGGLSVALSAAAVILAVFVVANRVTTRNAAASFGPGAVSSSANTESITAVPSGDGVTAYVTPQSDHLVAICDAVTNRTLRSQAVSTGQKYAFPIPNTGPNAAVVYLHVSGESVKHYFAVPGSGHASSTSGEGTALDFARAAADHYHIPVELDVANASTPAKWQFYRMRPPEAASQALGADRFAITWTDSNVLRISDH